MESRPIQTPPSLLGALVFTGLWLAITIVGGNWQSGGKSTLDELVVQGPLWGVWTALAFLAVTTLALRWSGLGFSRPDWIGAIRLMWLPGLFIAGAIAGGVVKGPPPSSVVLWILVNCLVVGISEEWAYRGVLLKGFRGRFSLMPAVILTSALFGVSHALNGFVTGDFGEALVQAVAAGMSGFLFAALRLRLGSILPVMLMHGLWDFSIFFLVQSTGGSATPDEDSTTPFAIFAPMLLVLPNLLYGIFLLRRSKRDPLGSDPA